MKLKVGKGQDFFSHLRKSLKLFVQIPKIWPTIKKVLDLSFFLKEKKKDFGPSFHEGEKKVLKILVLRFMKAKKGANPPRFIHVCSCPWQSESLDFARLLFAF